MRQNTKIALLIAVGFFLTLMIGLLVADNEFEQNESGVSFKWELKGEELTAVKAENKIIIDELKAVNADLAKQSVINQRIQEEADSTITREKKINAFLKAQLKNKDEEIDSLRAVIRSIRQSDI